MIILVSCIGLFLGVFAGYAYGHQVGYNMGAQDEASRPRRLLPVEYGEVLKLFAKSIKNRKMRHMWDNGDHKDSRCFFCAQSRWDKSITFPCTGFDVNVIEDDA